VVSTTPAPAATRAALSLVTTTCLLVLCSCTSAPEYSPVRLGPVFDAGAGLSCDEYCAQRHFCTAQTVEACKSGCQNEEQAQAAACLKYLAGQRRCEIAEDNVSCSAMRQSPCSTNFCAATVCRLCQGCVVHCELGTCRGDDGGSLAYCD